MLIYNYILTILYIFLVEFIWIYLINKKNYSLITKNVQKTDLKLNIKYAIISYILVIFILFFNLCLLLSYIRNKSNLFDNNLKLNCKKLHF